VRTRAAWSIAVLIACLAWSAPAGAAQVDGSLQVTGVTASTVTFTATAKRTCVTDEQCDYFSEIDQIDGDGPCPATRPDNPWIAWTGDVQNTGPSTENATITPRQWSSTDPVGPSRLCLFTYAELNYYLVGSAPIARPAVPGGNPSPPGTPTPRPPGAPGAPTPPGAVNPATVTCEHYTYQQSAQKALDANSSLAARLDRDGNGVACEGLPKRRTFIQTVGVAAAATTTRAALRRAYGKAFTQRAAYRARCARRSRTRVRCTVSWRHKGTWRGTVDVVGALRKNRPALLTQIHVRRP
jgi:hypothetical protein